MRCTVFGLLGGAMRLMPFSPRFSQRAGTQRTKKFTRARVSGAPRSAARVINFLSPPILTVDERVVVVFLACR